MSNESTQPTQIAHILFLDIVSWSRQSIEAQGRLLAELSRLVTECPTFKRSKAEGSLLAFPSGDGMWILFTGDLASPARCAVELAGLLKSVPDLSVRMGIHSGPVRFQTDIAGTRTVVGDGINMAKRVMDMGDGGHIVLSSQYASWLRQFEEWAPFVKPFGFGETKHGEQLELFTLASNDFGRTDPSSHITPAAKLPAAGAASTGLRIVVVYRRNTLPDEQLVATLESGLASEGYEVFVDRHTKIGIDWAQAIEEKIRQSDAVLAVLSEAAMGSEMLEFELEKADDERRKRGKPEIIPIRVGSDRIVEGPVGSYVNGLTAFVWRDSADDRRLLAELRSTVSKEPKPVASELHLEPVGGAVPPDSPFYEERASDTEFHAALRAHESIVLIKGPRQMGKTSLIGRGARDVRDQGWRMVSTDFQKLSSSQLVSDDAFYKLLAATIARQLKFKFDFDSEWLDVFGANMNLDNFVRTLLDESDEPLVWFMDEADKLFGVSFASDFFGLVRSWHNSRATEPGGPWSRFTVVIGYATEAHLFIQDLNQSPFNVGRQIPLQPFNLDQIWDLNGRYGKPLLGLSDAETLHQLVGGQPFLVRRALDAIARGQVDFGELVANADRDDGVFGDHLKRILLSVTQLPSVLSALRQSLTHPDMSAQADGIQRLLAAGVLKQLPDNRLVLANELYRRYLSAQIRE
ncbi:MAG: AAA-like domain-containing protein [Fimbriimonas sp.]|nr:AAA-like domain-containing protein [Fimbriimonas sp.]